jgi:hypothetical protein
MWLAPGSATAVSLQRLATGGAPSAVRAADVLLAQYAERIDVYPRLDYPRAWRKSQG